MSCQSPGFDLGVGSTGGATSASTTTLHATTTTGTGGVPATTGTGGVAEPSGPSALTVVNGIADYPAALFCFLPGDTPWPAARGLSFAAGQTVDLATALPAGADVTPWVIAGDLASVSGMTCTQILALAQPSGAGTGGGDGGTPPPVVAAELGLIPQSVLSAERSLLLVPTGCMGGAGHDNPSATQGCGQGYTSQTPTTGVVLVAMSRIADAAHVSLQAVNASVVLAASDVGVTPDVANTMEVVVAPSLGPGAIGPEPPFAALTQAEYGAFSGATLGVYSPGTTAATATATLGSVLAASAVGTTAFVNGANLVFVAVGGEATVPTGAFWQPLTFAVVKGAP